MRATPAFLLILALALPAPAFSGSAETLRKFESPEQRQRYWGLLEKLRCLVCQNESLASSKADLAEDLRDEVYTKMVEEGRTNPQIVDYLVARYGDFVLYRPPWGPTTYLLWTGPFLLLAIGLGVAVAVIRRRSAGHGKDPGADPAERARASALIEGDGEGHER